MLTRQDAEDFSLLIAECDNQRDLLDGSLNKMHLAKTYDELEEWYDWSKIHLRELDKKLHQKVLFMVEYIEQQGGKEDVNSR